METARSLGLKPEEQGAGMLDGEKLARVLQARAEAGLPVGNVAYMLAFRVAGFEQWYMQNFTSYRFTPVGILNVKTGHLISTDRELDAVLGSVRQEFDQLPFYKRWAMKWKYAQGQK